MRDLMGHHAGKLSLVFSGENQSGIHVKKATRKREGVDVVRFNDFDGEWDQRIRIANQILPERIDVVLYFSVFDQLRRGLDLIGVLLAHGNLVFQAVPIADATIASDVPGTNGLNITNAVVVIGPRHNSRRRFVERRVGSDLQGL